MKRICIIIAFLSYHFSPLISSASVSLRWTVETSRLQPAVFDVVSGETLALEASFQSYGTPVATSNKMAFLCWQTNGMASAWWVTNAVTTATVAKVLFTPDMDPGAPVVNAFLGLSDSTNQLTTTSYQLPSLSYRAAFTLRFRHGPGAAPNVIDKPVPILDLANTVVVNPPWPTKADFAATTTVMRAELKTYVDGQISGAGLVTPTMTTNIAGQVTSNVVTKSYVESLGISKGIDTNAVSSIITNHVDTGYLCTVAAAEAMTNTEYIVRYDNIGETGKKLKHGETAVTAEDVGALKERDDEYGLLAYWEGYALSLTEVKAIKYRFNSENTAYINDDGLYYGGNEYLWPVSRSSGTFATTSDIPDAYTKQETENAIVAATNNDIIVRYENGSLNHGGTAVTASDVGAYPNSYGQQLSAQVATQGAYLNAEDAQFVSTNYDSVVNMPEAYVRIKLQQGGTNVWRTIWEEMRRWNAFTGSGFNWQTWGGFHTWSTNLTAMIEETSPKEYAFYDGVTGEVAPDGFFWISQPRIAICAGAGYQRYLDAGGEVWILESNGLVANIGGTTNGYFRISDEEGNTQFEIIKGDKETVPAIARSMRREEVMGVTHWICDYAVTNAIAPPVAKFCRNLGANPPVWTPDTDASCPCNVTWTPGVNTYTLEFWPKSTETTMFCKAEYDRGGETMIRQTIPTEMQYIILNGTKYGLVPKTVNGELVIGLTTGN